MREDIRLAFQGIWSHKLRSFLTMLGVIIGIASIIAIVSTIKGTNEQIKTNLIGAGNNCVDVKLMQGEEEYWMDMGAPSGVYPITQEQRASLESLDFVEGVSLYYKRPYAESITAGSNRLDAATIYGVEENYLSIEGYGIVNGRGFTESDYKSFSKVALLDQTAAETLFESGNAVGQTIEIKGEPFKIVGTIRRKESSLPVIKSIEDYYTYYGDEQYGFVLITTACWPIVYQYDEPQNALLVASDTDRMSRVGKDAAEVMNQAVIGNSEVSYAAEDLLQKAKNLQDLSSSTNSLLLWIAGISLLVGGIGVMNIMLVSVTERTAEIGLKKAIGARNRRILMQFLTESATLTTCGGVIGILVGIFLAKIISSVADIPVAISIPAILIGVLFSMAIGILFGLLPSMKAAKLNPIEALATNQ